ncbi:hypothetical protein BASA81_002309 [Batrachochytrium salamandrivorans]|nr:hypothetical protein BASA81_002309 [Batrachochytrium salamandrivorans]
MTTLKQRHKLELKQLNQEGDARVQGKKGSERQAALRQTEQLKRAMLEKHDLELKQAEEEAEAAPKQVEGVVAAAPQPQASQEPKLSRAREKQLRKEQREHEAKLQREAELAAKGPTIRDLEMSTLVKQIGALGLKMKEINPDGNCLYGAVANQLEVCTGEVESVDDLRNRAANVMERNRDLFEPFLPEDEEFEQYVSRVRVNGEWGGEMELRALSLALQRPIWVHCVHSPVVKMGQQEFTESSILHVTFHEHQFAMGEHYNSAVPINNHSTV